MKLGRLRTSSIAIALACSSLVTFQALRAQDGDNAATADDDAAVETEAGIPVTDPLVIAKCGTCHRPDDDGNLSRISWMRTTPEYWAQSIKRMVKLNGLSISPEEARAVVKSLSATHGLAPEEAMQVAYLPEKRHLDETNIPNDAVRGACASCHAFAQPLSWRRSSREWEELQEFHVALYSQADRQFNQREGGRDATDGPTNGEIALEYMREVAPLHTPEWASWSSRQSAPRLAGDWLLTASIPGQGRYVGTVSIAPGGGQDEFVTSTAMRSLADGSVIEREGVGLLYGGYAWRGSSEAEDSADGPQDPVSDVRETMHFASDQQSATGRWFWGGHHEFGYDVTLTRATAAPAILAVGPGAVKAGDQGAELTVYGHNLPTDLSPQDIALGTGLTLRSIVSASADQVVLSVDAADGAVPGPRDVAIGNAVLEKAFPVYANVDYIEVTPETGFSRLGGIRFPKRFEQFEATGYDNGPDGEEGTADDVAIGLVDAEWSVEEFMTTDYDNDVQYVGDLSQAALFTPNVEGPNPERRHSRNNYGEVWVVATAKDAVDEFGKPLSARAYLVVTPPAYKIWDQPELFE